MTIFKKTFNFIFGNSDQEAIKHRFDEAMSLDRFIINLNHDDLENHRYTDTLLVTCVDFRFRGEIGKLMNDIFYLLCDYDEIALPGASLALVEKSFPNWSQTISEVIGVLKKIHHIKRVIFLDHRDCGAYKFIKGKDAVANKEIETHTHREVFKEARVFMKENFPELKVYTLLIGLDGIVENFKE
jgi:hypothetical protein